MREIVVGTGGDDHAGAAAPITGSQVRNNTTFGVRLHAGSYDFRFVPEPGKTFTDFGSGNCHGAPPAGDDRAGGRRRPAGQEEAGESQALRRS